MWEKLKHLLKAFYLKIKCYMCCKSNCMIQIGKEEQEK